FLPDKAIDLVDEAASKLRMEIDSMPAELDEVERAITRLEIEREALKKETDAASKERLGKLERELAHAKEEASVLRAHWQQEKAAITEIREKRQQLEAIRADVERAERAADYAKAAELKYSTVAGVEKEIARAEKRLADLQKNQKMLTEEVTPEDIADVVAKWTGIRSRSSSKAKSRSFCAWSKTCTSASSARRRRSRPWRTRCVAHAPACRTPTGLSARSCSSVRQALARPCWRRPSRNSSSTTSPRPCASTCLSTWRSTPSRDSSALRPGTSGSRKAVS